jgi:hypothetical protein
MLLEQREAAAILNDPEYIAATVYVRVNITSFMVEQEDAESADDVIRSWDLHCDDGTITQIQGDIVTMGQPRPAVSTVTMTRITDALEKAHDRFELIASAYAEAPRYVLYERLYVLEFH